METIIAAVPKHKWPLAAYLVNVSLFAVVLTLTVVKADMTMFIRFIDNTIVQATLLVCLAALAFFENFTAAFILGTILSIGVLHVNFAHAKRVPLMLPRPTFGDSPDETAAIAVAVASPPDQTITNAIAIASPPDVPQDYIFKYDRLQKTQHLEGYCPYELEHLTSQLT